MMGFWPTNAALGLFRLEELSLRLSDRFLIAHAIMTFSAITPGVVGRLPRLAPHRHTPRSYNHLRGTRVRLFEWFAAHDQCVPSPLRLQPTDRSSRVCRFYL